MSKTNDGSKAVADIGDTSSQSVSPIKRISYLIRSLLRLRTNPTLKESVEEAIEEHDSVVGDAIEDDEKTMLRNVLSFAEMDVEDVMVPLADVNGVEFDISYDELKKFILEKAHTRIPVYRGTMDDIAGFVHIKDLLIIAYDKSNEFDMSKIIRQCLFVPPSMKTSALLMKMQLSHVHIAIVVDEYGGTDGLVTLEDLVEEIVGEIEDEHDRVDDIIFTPLGNSLFEASARIDIKDLEKKLETKLYKNGDSEDFETLGGLIFHTIGRVPALGEIISIASTDEKFNIEIEVTDADMRKVKRVIIARKPVE